MTTRTRPQPSNLSPVDWAARADLAVDAWHAARGTSREVVNRPVRSYRPGERLQIAMERKRLAHAKHQMRLYA